MKAREFISNQLDHESSSGVPRALHSLPLEVGDKEEKWLPITSPNTMCLRSTPISACFSWLKSRLGVCEKCISPPHVCGKWDSEGLAPVRRGQNALSFLHPLILSSALFLLGWKEMLHLPTKKQRGRASEFISEKNTDFQR